jgi:hypothetical protein
MDTTAASSSVTRSSTSFCFMAASSRRMVPRRSLSLARIAAFMSSLIWSLSDMANPPFGKTKPAPGVPGAGFLI